MGGHLYLWATPILAPVFNHGKTVPGGGRGSRSPPHVSFLCFTQNLHVLKEIEMALPP